MNDYKEKSKYALFSEKYRNASIIKLRGGACVLSKMIK